MRQPRSSGELERVTREMKGDNGKAYPLEYWKQTGKDGLRVCPETSVRITKFSEHEPD